MKKLYGFLTVFILLLVCFIITIPLSCLLRPVSNEDLHFNHTYTPIVIEMHPNRSIALVQSKFKFWLTQKEFSKIGLSLKQCFERSRACHLVDSGKDGCTYTAHMPRINICYGRSKNILRAAIGPIILHREDLLQLYEL